MYSATYQLSLTLAALGWPFLYALLPVLGERTRANDQAGMREAVRGSFRWMMITLIPATAGLSLTGNQLIRLIATPEFAPGTILVALVACGILLDTLGNNLQYVFYVQNRSEALRKIFFQVAGFNILSNLIAMPFYGIMGAGVVTLVTFVLSIFLLAQEVRIPLREWLDTGMMLRCLLLGGIVAGWVTLTLRDELTSLAIAIAGAAVLYAVGLLALRVLPLSEIRRLISRRES